MDTCSSCISDDVDEVLKEHVTELTKMYPRALIFEYIEANLSYLGANRMANITRRISPHNIRVESKDPTPKARDGIWTGENEKYQYATAIAHALSVGSLCYADDSCFVSRNPVEVKDKFEKQLAQFRRITSPNPNPAFQKAKVTYSGEGKDDTVIVCGMCLYFSFDKRNSEEYNQIAQASGFIV